MYKKILIALSFEEQVDKQLLCRLHEIRKINPDAKIHLVHAVTQIVAMGLAYGLSLSGDLELELKKEADKHMLKQSTLFDSSTATVELGSARDIILEQANKLKVDLIIIGSHVQKGLQTLLGSTANTICHSAGCDVLAVRINGV